MDKLDNLVRETARQMPDTFDTHELTLRLAHQNQLDYIALLSDAGSETPFLALHSQIGKTIKMLAAEIGLRGEASSSKDIFGQESSCIRWYRS